eukprot:15172971-Alexandrium_andersonii.AAC.1
MAWTLALMSSRWPGFVYLRSFSLRNGREIAAQEIMPTLNGRSKNGSPSFSGPRKIATSRLRRHPRSAMG